MVMASSPTSKLRENNFRKAQLAIEAGRHDHAARFLLEITSSVAQHSELSPFERIVFSTTFNGIIENQLQALDILNQSTYQSELSASYSKRIVHEIKNFCGTIKLFIKDRLIPLSRSLESMVFYLTFMGDVSRCIAELEEDEGEEKKAMMEAIYAFTEANAIAKAELTWLNPVTLTMALHRAALYWDFLEQHEKGFEIVNKALMKAIEAGGDATEGESAKEITELMSKLSEYYISLFETDEEQEVESPASGIN